MKLRIKGQSVRFRLSPKDTEALGQGQAVIETLSAGGLNVVYGLIPTHEEGWYLDTSRAGVVIHCPQNLLSEWATTDRVGLETELSADAGRVLGVLVEKDFQCLVPRGEDDGTTFPHPRATP